MTIYQRLNRHISTFPCVLVEHKGGKVYLLKDHWKYLNQYKEPERVCIGRGRVGPKRFEYLTHLFPCFKRTKFTSTI
jgi:hypothetical protein